MNGKSMTYSIVGITISVILVASVLVPFTSEGIWTTETLENEPNNGLSIANEISVANDGAGNISMSVDGKSYTFQMTTQPWMLLAYSPTDQMYLGLTAASAAGFWEPTYGFGSTPINTTWSFSYSSGTWNFDNDTRNIHHTGTFTGDVYAYDPDGDMAFYNSAYYSEDYPAPHFDKGSEISIVTIGAYWTFSAFATSTDYENGVVGTYYASSQNPIALQGDVTATITENDDGTISLTPGTITLPDSSVIDLNITSTGIVGMKSYHAQAEYFGMIHIIPLIVLGAILLSAVALITRTRD